MTAATVASFLISTVMVTWPVKGRMHLTSPAENAVNLKSGNGWSKTLPEETTGPPGGICWRPRCCASEAGGGSASAATRATVSNGADRGMTEPLSLPGAAPCDLVVSRAPGFRCALTLPRRRHLRQIAPVLLIRRPAGSLHEFVNVGVPLWTKRTYRDICFLSAFGGKADMGRSRWWLCSDATDPKRTKTGLKSRSAAAAFGRIVVCHSL